MINYNDLVKEIEGKSLKEITEMILNKKLFKDVDNISMFSKVDSTINKIIGLSKDVPSIYLFLKRENIFFDALELFTTIELIPRDGSMNDYNINLELAMKNVNIKFNMYYELVEEGLKVLGQSTINELIEIFNTKLPSIEDIQAMKNELDNVFSDESPEKLEKIENILAFNDPTMVGIKDALIQSGIDKAREKTTNIVEVKQNKN